MQFTAAIAAAVLAFTSGASAHMLLASPVPFSGGDNSPLDPSGSNFPCKTSSYSVAKMNNWEAGSTQSVSFTGSAVHGGGSCQFSFTTDQKPTKDSTWKVIHSVIGGCPKANTAGNLAENADGTGADKFAITIPEDTPNGQLTFAWTWFNKVGNREMYMGCAPVTITGGADSSKALEALPDMFTANIGADCETIQDQDVVFPNSGSSVVKLGLAQSLGAPGFQGTACQAPSKDGQQAPDVSDPAPSDVTVPTPVPSDVTAPTPTPSDVIAPAPAPSDVIAPAPAPSSVTAPAPAPAPSNVTAPTTGGSACSTEGALICIDSTHFAICDNGKAVSQAVSSGTTCQNGAITRRAVRHPRRHGSNMLRRHGHAFKA